MAPRPTYCISSAIPYANGAPHIGHAYERIAQDAIVRFKRLDGFDVLSLSGHGRARAEDAADGGARRPDPAGARRPHRRPSSSP